MDMPKDRKMTYSDHQAQASRLKKQAPKKKVVREDVNPRAAGTVKEAKKD